MGMFYAYGGALIDEDEIQAKTEAGHFARFSQRRSDDAGNAVIDFSTGRMTANDGERRRTATNDGEPR